MDMSTPSKSPWSTSESSPLRVSIVDSSTPCNELSLVFRTSPRLSARYGFGSSSTTQRARLRDFVLLVWIISFTVIFLWWLLNRDRETSLFSYKINLSSSGLPTLDGLQFIDAAHPYIRYVGRWTSAPDKTRKDGSFPGTSSEHSSTVNDATRIWVDKFWPGVYFDFAFNGSNTILLSLHNTDVAGNSPTSSSPNMAFLPTTNISHAGILSRSSLNPLSSNRSILLSNC
jgi:hypothetical protein